ncbi:MAG: hypothetical protein A2827_01675 [Candidatus Spechtbacteria bacterium RIFCSPHIGHO2_01_FULL_43_30]|uniref:MOSC domain-containing protein n=1 Tax=Candidatus Spechtbacteria bacterium RIFCSPHIGHO2_01_FULL_43_30 TaxID=1802158 RepID=A0A1G2H7A5_9BACT|nr:MAG: hypothetical protein A2827_01675 [Candidatus Spechtbacteria bacterium RIFCSPHIGHO2_01_FULL_43_30]
MTTPGFEMKGRVEAVLVASNFGSILSMPCPRIQMIRGHGVRGDSHAGVRFADAREKALFSFGFSKGIEIANHREFSAVSVEELAEVAKAMNLPKPIPYGCLGENLVLSGIQKLSELPSGTMLFFRRDEQIRTAVLAVWAENMPCKGPGEVIQKNFPEIPGLARLFPKAAIGKRGIVGSIYASGNIQEGDTVVAKIPRQRIYKLE